MGKKLSDITKKEIQDLAEKIIGELTKTNKKRLAFFEEEQDVVMKKVLEYLLSTGKTIVNEDISESTEGFPFSYEELNLLTENIFSYAQKTNNIIVENDSIFQKMFVRFKYGHNIIELFRMYGQGTFTQLKLHEENNEFSFNYDEVFFVE